jgi:adenine phosphoribosyltransferase
MDVGPFLRSHIRTVPDWPAPGVQFRDITPLLQDPKVFRVLIDAFVHRYMDQRPDVVAGLDARGFILGSVVAYELGLGFVPIRKKGKLPFTTVEETYELEYGSATVELHTDAVKPARSCWKSWAGRWWKAARSWTCRSWAGRKG